MTTTTKYPFDKADSSGLWIDNNPGGTGYDIADRANDDQVIAHFATIELAEAFIDGALWAWEQG